MLEFVATALMAAISESLVAVRVLSTTSRRPALAAFASMGCRTLSLLVVVNAVRDSWVLVIAAMIGYFVGPYVTIMVMRR